MIRRRLSRAVALALLIAVGFLPAVPAQAQDTTSVEVNTKDGSDVFRLAFGIRRIMGDVDQGNAAAAVSSCVDCRTIAVSIQVLLVTGDPEVVSPTNLALAQNISCSLCESMASAYQIVIGTGGPVRLTGEGYQQIVDILQRIREVGESDASLAEIDAGIDALVDELKQVLETELVPVGATETPAPTDTPLAPSPEGSVSASTSVSPSPSVTESPPPSAEPSASEPVDPSPTVTP